MKITFICGVFPPEPAPSGVMATQLGKRLADDGHDVTIITGFPNRPAGILYPDYRMKLWSKIRTAEGYTVIRCASWFIGKKRRVLRRILENISFGISSACAVWLTGRPDVLIIESWPFFATQIPASLATFWATPFLYYVKDVYPESAEVAGILSADGILSRLLRIWDRHLCRRSYRVVVISNSMRDLLVAGRNLPLDRFVVIPDWLDTASFPVWRGNNAWRISNGIDPSSCLALFAGTLGHISGADVLVKVAQLLRQENAVIVCVGDGVLKQSMTIEADRLCLENIRFLPFQPGERVPEIQGAADVALLTMRPNASDASVPSKLISYFAAAKAVICAANPNSAVAHAVSEANAGVVVPPGDPRAIADAVLRLARCPDLAREFGQNGRSYFERHYTLDRAHIQFREILVELEDRTSLAQRASKSMGLLAPRIGIPKGD
jgi:colanic acid biosynthesis glycosyl transferase WcaI